MSYLFVAPTCTQGTQEEDDRKQFLAAEIDRLHSQNTALDGDIKQLRNTIDESCAWAPSAPTAQMLQDSCSESLANKIGQLHTENAALEGEIERLRNQMNMLEDSRANDKEGPNDELGDSKNNEIGRLQSQLRVLTAVNKLIAEEVEQVQQKVDSAVPERFEVMTKIDEWINDCSLNICIPKSENNGLDAADKEEEKNDEEDDNTNNCNEEEVYDKNNDDNKGKVENKEEENDDDEDNDDNDDDDDESRMSDIEIAVINQNLCDDGQNEVEKKGLKESASEDTLSSNETSRLQECKMTCKAWGCGKKTLLTSIFLICIIVGLSLALSSRSRGEDSLRGSPSVSSLPPNNGRQEPIEEVAAQVAEQDRIKESVADNNDFAKSSISKSRSDGGGNILDEQTAFDQDQVAVIAAVTAAPILLESMAPTTTAVLRDTVPSVQGSPKPLASRTKTLTKAPSPQPSQSVLLYHEEEDNRYQSEPIIAETTAPTSSTTGRSSTFLLKPSVGPTVAPFKAIPLDDTEGSDEQNDPRAPKIGKIAEETESPILSSADLAASPSRQPSQDVLLQDNFEQRENPIERPSHAVILDTSEIQPDMIVAVATGSMAPSTSSSTAPSMQGSVKPSARQTKAPTALPSLDPSAFHSGSPSNTLSGSPSQQSSIPSSSPSSSPTKALSTVPTSIRSSTPSSSPTAVASATPSVSISTIPSEEGSAMPSTSPTAVASSTPSVTISATPSVEGSSTPSSTPTAAASSKPSVAISATPSAEGSSTPSETISGEPTDYPSPYPTSQDSQMPSASPSSNPTFWVNSSPGFLVTPPLQDVRFTDGVMFDITARDSDLAITSIDLNLNSKESNIPVEVRWITASHQGWELYPHIWRSIEKYIIQQGNGKGTLTPISEDFVPIQIKAGETVGIYVYLPKGQEMLIGSTNDYEIVSDDSVAITSGADVPYPFLTVQRDASWSGASWSGAIRYTLE